MNEAGSTPSISRATGHEASNAGLKHHYIIRFRQGVRESTACADSGGLQRGDVVMVRLEQGLEPATLGGRVFAMAPAEEKSPRTEKGEKTAVCPEIVRLASEDEAQQFKELLVQEQEAFAFCQQQVEKLQLIMHLVRVERFFNGSKIIFYFTAENRVDFRELVKILVQQYRTRIEMRQIGVRHETQMLGGLGACGRELCCSTFLNAFDSVSIKMAKTQDLPLNPAKISGICNRLLCCLTYEYDSYKTIKRQMPRVGKTIRIKGVSYLITQQHPLNGTLTVTAPDGSHKLLREEEWRQSEPEGAGSNQVQESSATGAENRAGSRPSHHSSDNSNSIPNRQSRRRKNPRSS